MKLISDHKINYQRQFHKYMALLQRDSELQQFILFPVNWGIQQMSRMFLRTKSGAYIS